MSTLITLGCSFSEGVGCYDLELLDNYKSVIDGEYVEKNKDNFLKGSIGSNLQNKFGYEKYINYAYGGSSNLGQFFNFFNNLPTDDDVTILWQITFYLRKATVTNKEIKDYTLKDEWVHLLYESKIKEYDNEIYQSSLLDDDDRIEISYYIKIMKEFCKLRGWKFYTWFWENGEYRKVGDINEQIKDCIIPFNKEPLSEDDTYQKFTEDGHPNEKGYQKISDTLIRSIDTFIRDFPKPNKTPNEKKNINYIR